MLIYLQQLEMKHLLEKLTVRNLLISPKVLLWQMKDQLECTRELTKKIQDLKWGFFRALFIRQHQVLFLKLLTLAAFLMSLLALEVLILI